MELLNYEIIDVLKIRSPATINDATLFLKAELNFSFLISEFFLLNKNGHIKKYASIHVNMADWKM